jgi:superfamily II DNA helicase RecQ
MHCRVFDIRLSSHRDADQATLNAFLDHVDVVSTTATLVTTNTQFWSVLVFYKELPGTKREERPAIVDQEQLADTKPERSWPADQIDLDSEQEQVYNKLRQWRSNQAQTEGVPVYVVAHNSMLQQIAKRGISSREELLQIERFGSKRVEKYGDAILDVLAGETEL